MLQEGIYSSQSRCCRGLIGFTCSESSVHFRAFRNGEKVANIDFLVLGLVIYKSLLFQLCKEDVKTMNYAL